MERPDQSDSSIRDPLERLAEDFLERHRRGDSPAVSEYAENHPELADEIRDLLPTLLGLERLRARHGEEATAGQRGSGAAGLRRLGEYTIVREVGRGGMGVVYEAVQETLGRRVALKVLPYHHLRDQYRLDRFRREARAAAALQHPHIVPVYGVGEAEGVHYYVMQYIRGRGLDDVLGELRRLRGKHGDRWSSATARVWRGSSAPESGEEAIEGARAPASVVSASDRLPDPPSSSATVLQRPRDGSLPSELDYPRNVARLGLQVAGALAYAHGQGVLHRDVKPSNLLLEPGGTVWVTDFGLAKEEGSDDLTLSGEIVGTLRYLAPERLRGWSDPRSDVYSLGVTLYELLTLEPPIDDTDRGRLLKKITEEEPRAPREIDARVPRDLETIVLKSLEKDPQRRYGSMDELAADLGRFLRDEPIHARRPSALDRAAKWSRRHRASVTAALVVLLLTVVGLVASTLIVLDQRNEAEEQRDRAQTNYRIARDAIGSMYTRAAERLAKVPGMKGLRREILEEALRAHQRFLMIEGASPEVRYDAASVHLNVGVIYGELGRLVEQEESLQQALALFAGLVDEFPENASYRMGLAECHDALSTLYTDHLGRADAALEHRRKELSIRMRLAEDFPSVSEHVRRLAICHTRVGHAIVDETEAEAHYRTALRLWERHHSDFEVPRDYVRSAETHFFLGFRLLGWFRPEEAEAELRRALELRSEYGERTPGALSERGFRLAVADNERALAEVLLDLGRREEAEPLLRDAVHVLETAAADLLAVLGFESPEVRHEAACAHQDIGVIYGQLGRFADQERHAIEALELLESCREECPESTNYRETLADCHALLGNLYAFDMGRADTGIAHRRKELSVRESLAEEFPAVPEYVRRLAICHTDLGNTVGDVDESEAEAHDRAALRLWARYHSEFDVPRDYVHSAISHFFLGFRLLGRSRPEEAEAELRRALELRSEYAARNPRALSGRAFKFDLADNKRLLGEALVVLDRCEEAEPLLRDALRAFEEIEADVPAGETDADVRVRIHATTELLGGHGSSEGVGGR